MGATINNKKAHIGQGCGRFTLMLIVVAVHSRGKAAHPGMCTIFSRLTALAQSRTSRRCVNGTGAATSTKRPAKKTKTAHAEIDKSELTCSIEPFIKRKKYVSHSPRNLLPIFPLEPRNAPARADVTQPSLQQRAAGLQRMTKEEGARYTPKTTPALQARDLGEG